MAHPAKSGFAALQRIAIAIVIARRAACRAAGLDAQSRQSAVAERDDHQCGKSHSEHDFQIAFHGTLLEQRSAGLLRAFEFSTAADTTNRVDDRIDGRGRPVERPETHMLQHPV